MNKPIISWFVLEEHDEEFSYIPKKKHEEAESFSPGDFVTIRLKIWNNIGGTETVSDATDAKLVVYFKNFENNLFLNLIKVRKMDEEFTELDIDLNRGYFNLGSISGRANNGSDANYDNYKEIELKLGPIPENIKSEVKEFVLDIEYNETAN